MEFAVKIKHYRQQNDWTQQVVAEKLGVSRKTISSWENGRSYPDIFMLVQLSDLYHVSLDDLLREDHEMIDSYKQEHVTNAKYDRTFTISYIINVVLLSLPLVSRH
ncbi:helix-turn-helix domain-containing protein [Limosilactobacillus panis]|nr:helix-turn-helix transcriptional regulator [Limosilactobacillus panis]QZN92940.1 helix-turn-helix domain-containing protein [Limosilactobacillus panis]